jgi:hypothetical protein
MEFGMCKGIANSEWGGQFVRCRKPAEEVPISRISGCVLAVVCLVLVCFSPVTAARNKRKDAAAAELKVPPEDAKKTNPLKSDSNTIAEEKKLYASQCALCRGKDSDGKGNLAGDMKLTMPNYQDPAALKDETESELFYILPKGKGDMPGEGDPLSETQR